MSHAKRFQELVIKKNTLLQALVPLARNASNILKDLGQVSSADELKAKLFEIDALDQEMIELFKNNPELVIELLNRI
jgi:hypothetical protein